MAAAEMMRETANGIAYELIVSKRKTLEIAVHPDKRVVVKAPISQPIEETHTYVEKRAGWIKKQLRYYEKFDPRKPPRQYVRGESHLYKGRQYRLKIEQSEGRVEKVQLDGEYIRISAASEAPQHIKAVLEGWYMKAAAVWFEEVFEQCWQRFAKKGVAKPRMKIRLMKTCWGSMSARGNMNLNLLLIQAPRECLEYVVIHELCHLIHHNHGAGFYRLQEQMLPDWAERKKRLELVFARC